MNQRVSPLDGIRARVISVFVRVEYDACGLLRGLPVVFRRASARDSKERGNDAEGVE